MPDTVRFSGSGAGAGAGIRIVSPDLKRFAAALRTARGKMRAAMREGILAPAQELNQEVIRVGSDEMPHRGGLAARIAAAHGGVSVVFSSDRVAVTLRDKTVEGYRLRAIDRTGIVRHPVFAHMKVWATTNVPAHAFTKVFEAGAPKIRQDLRAAVQRTLAEIAAES